MNDAELNEILDSWRAPEPPDSLRRRTRAAYGATMYRPPMRRRMVLWAFGLASFLFALAVAFPQTMKLVAPGEKPPYTVDSDFTYYAPDGSVEREEIITSYNDSKGEVVLSRSIVGNALESMLLQMHGFLFGFHRAQFADEAKVVANGCVREPEKIVNRESILNYETVAVHSEGNGVQYTGWRAPALACFPLRESIQRKQPGGSWHRIMERRAIKVTVNK